MATHFQGNLDSRGGVSPPSPPACPRTVWAIFEISQNGLYRFEYIIVGSEINPNNKKPASIKKNVNWDSQQISSWACPKIVD